MTLAIRTPKPPHDVFLCSCKDEREQRKCLNFRRSKEDDWCKYSMMSEDQDFVCIHAQAISKNRE